MQSYRVSPSQINLEITETATTHAQNIMEANIIKLRNAGITFSLDDYGTGYSNMKSVASLPLDIIKLDKSLINDKNDPRMQSVLKNTVAMLKEMNLKILIEGIETEEMLNEFIKLKCDYVQGYYFSKPIPQKAFVEFIRSSLILPPRQSDNVGQSSDSTLNISAMQNEIAASALKP
jgi:EAL domain-containing protein (putative c-di-GMP-specific phosphodiesterase class I)